MSLDKCKSVHFYTICSNMLSQCSSLDNRETYLIKSLRFSAIIVDTVGEHEKLFARSDCVCLHLSVYFSVFTHNVPNHQTNKIYSATFFKHLLIYLFTLHLFGVFVLSWDDIGSPTVGNCVMVKIKKT